MAHRFLFIDIMHIWDTYLAFTFIGDYGMDQLYPNNDVCPKLDVIQESAYTSPDWIAKNTSSEMFKLNSDLDNILGKGQWSWNYVFDCMMTTVCSGRAIPDGRGEIKMSDAIFNATIRQSEAEMAFLNLYNNSEYAKLAMGNTIWHIRKNIQNAVNNISGINSGPPYKLALFAGHDTTIMPLLAAILGPAWDRVWPGYASLLTIEVYESAESNIRHPSFLFRMVYNGETLIVPPCNSALCDLTILLDKLAFGEESMPCDANPVINVLDNENNCVDSPLSTTEWSVITVMSALAGILLGAGMVIFYDRRRIQLYKLIDQGKDVYDGSPIHGVF